jgi:5'-nucleotidase/UDP-sugar diphosphatase
VAFLGLTTLKSVQYPQTKGLRFQDPIEAARIWIPRARAQADVVIALTHLGVDQDRAFARRTRGVDAIIGGDSHTFLYTPVQETNLDGRSVPIVQDGEFGADLGELRLTFSRSGSDPWTLEKARDRLIPVSRQIRADPRIAQLVESYARVLDVVVGRLPQVGADTDARKQQTADILAAAWRSSVDADLGVQPEDATYEVFRTRRVSLYQIHAILPFHEDVVVVSLKGDAVNALLKAPLRAFVGRLHLSSNGSPINPTALYRVAMLSTAAVALKVSEAQDSGLEARNSLENFFRNQAS